MNSDLLTRIWGAYRVTFINGKLPEMHSSSGPL